MAAGAAVKHTRRQKRPRQKKRRDRRKKRRRGRKWGIKVAK